MTAPSANSRETVATSDYLNKPCRTLDEAIAEYEAEYRRPISPLRRAALRDILPRLRQLRNEMNGSEER